MTLLYAAADRQHNNAIALQEFLESRIIRQNHVI